MDSQSNRTINLFNKFNLVIPETLTYHIDGFPERRSAFIIDNDDSFVITFEEGMKCLDMSNDKSLVCFNHRIDERYVHQQRFGKNNIAFFHIELDNSDGEKIYLPGQMVTETNYKWSDGLEPILIELLKGISLSDAKGGVGI